MNALQSELLSRFLEESDQLFNEELQGDENNDYRCGYYAGRLHAALSITMALTKSEEKQIDLKD